jgi:hypothetical protein
MRAMKESLVLRPMRGMRRGLPVLVAAILVLAAATAEAATFGPDLTAATANYPYSCGFAGGSSGCTLQDPLNDDMELVLPDPVAHGNQTAVVTAIHVRSTATAPAQFVAVEWSGRPGEANPFPSGVMAVSQQVTLQPGLNNFNTNLPVDRRLASNGFESWSVVSLDILNGSSPIPAESGGSFATTGFLLDNGLPLTQTVADLTVPPHYVSVGGLPPATLLMSGEVTITTGQGGGGTNNGGNKTPTPTPPNPTPPRPVAQLVIPSVGQIKGKTATVPIRCVGPANCVGVLRIQNLPEPGATAAKKAKKAKPVTYASGSFSISAGRTLSVTVRLSKDGKRAIKGHHSLKAYANATFSDGHDKSSKITFRH